MLYLLYTEVPCNQYPPTHTHTHTHTHTTTTPPHTQDFLLTRIPRDNVCVNEAATDPAFGSATLEVGLNNPILEAGFEIICAPTTTEDNLEAVRKTLQVCQVELHPFFVYAHDGKKALTDQVKR